MVVHYVSSLAGASNTVTVPITVQVTAVNDDTTPSFASNPTIPLGEETAVGTTVYTYTGVDDDGPPHDIVKYEILGNYSINIPEYHSIHQQICKKKNNITRPVLNYRQTTVLMSCVKCMLIVQ